MAKKTYQFFDQFNCLYQHIQAATELNNNILKASFQISSELKQKEILLDDVEVSGDKIARKQGLWQDTCFEIFIKNKMGDDYYEINFSPENILWNAYYFKTYRDTLIETNQISLLHYSHHSSKLELSFKIPEGDYDFYPKVILFQQLNNKTIFLSHLPHPKTGPDFHLFSVS